MATWLGTPAPWGCGVWVRGAVGPEWACDSLSLFLREKKYHEEMSQQEWAGSGIGWLVASLALLGRTLLRVRCRNGHETPA